MEQEIEMPSTNFYYRGKSDSHEGYKEGYKYIMTVGNMKYCNAALAVVKLNEEHYHDGQLTSEEIISSQYMDKKKLLEFIAGLQKIADEIKE